MLLFEKQVHVFIETTMIPIDLDYQSESLRVMDECYKIAIRAWVAGRRWSQKARNLSREPLHFWFLKKGTREYPG